MASSGRCIMWLRVPRLGTVTSFLLCMRGWGSLVNVNDAVVIVVSKEVLMANKSVWAGSTGRGLLWEWGPSHCPLARG